MNEEISQAASDLGRQAAGVPKRLTPEERERRRAAMKELNRKREEGKLQRIVRVEGKRVEVEVPATPRLVTIRA